ncbi:MAG: DUF3857 domain-containing protein [Bacteroidales bacterium]|jgi:hypothetical protein
MKTKVYLLLLFFCLLSSGFLFSQDENYDAVYLQLKKEYTLNPDGSMDFRYMKKLKLQTYRSFNSLYGETFIPYNPDYQSLKINEAYTIMADGKKNPSPANAYNEVLPRFAANAPAYNNLREMVVTHTGTERNAIINLDYELHSKKGFYPCLMGNELLAELEPIKELSFVIKVPLECKLKYSILNSTAVPIITKENNFQVYTWKFTNIPAISTEDFQKGGDDLYTKILFSTAENRSALYKDVLQNSPFSFVLNDEMKKAVAAIIKENQEKSAILLKLQDKVINEFRLYPIPIKITGFSCRTPEQIWNSNGGTPLEKAVLLSALLKEAGIESEPALMVKSTLFNESIGSLSDIEDILVKATLPDGPIYLSLNSLNPQDLLYCFPERVFIELNQGGIKVEKTSSYKNELSLNGTLTVNEKNQLSGDVSFTESKGTNPYLMLLHDKNKAKSLVGGGITSSDLQDLSITKSGIKESTVVIAIRGEKAFRKDSDYYFFQLPLLTNGIESLGIHLLTKDRTTPLEISSPIEENYNFVIFLPEKMKLFLPNEKKEIKNDEGSFIYEIKTEGNKTIIHKSIKLEKQLIETSEYADFKSLLDHWNANHYRELVFTTNN